MATKLTLSVDNEVIKRAKKAASRQGLSLSKLVESFLRNLINEPEKGDVTNPVLKKLSGSVHVPADFDYRKELKDALLEKYVK